jgi:hypothetical protein
MLAPLMFHKEQNQKRTTMKKRSCDMKWWLMLFVSVLILGALGVVAYAAEGVPAGISEQELLPGAGASDAAPEFVPGEIVLPDFLPFAAQWLTEGLTVKLGGMVGIIIALVQALKMIAGAMHLRLTGKPALLMTALLALLSAAGMAVGDGVLSGDDWPELLLALIGFGLASFGYKALFSSNAKDWLKRKTA